MKTFRYILIFISVLALVSIYSFSSLDAVLMPRITLLSIILGAFSLFSWKKIRARESLFFKSLHALPFYLFLLTGLVSMLWAKNYSESIFYWIKDLLFVALFYPLYLRFSNSNDFVKSFLRALALGSSVCCFWAFYNLFQWNAEYDLFVDDPLGITANMAHKNLLSSALLIWLPFNLYTFKVDVKIWKYLALFNTIASLFFIFILEARSSWLALFMMLMAWTLIHLLVRYGSKWKLNIPKVWVILPSILIVGISVFLHFKNRVEKDTKQLSLEPQIEELAATSFTVKERLLLWKGSSRMALDNSVVGVGPGNWRFQFPKYGSDMWRARQGWVQFQRPHNDFVWVYTENGIVGALSYGLMFLVILYLGLKALQNSTLNKTDKLLLKLSLLSIIGYVTVANFSFPRERVIHSAMLFSSFALVASLFYKNQKVNIVKDRNKAVPILILGASIFTAFIGFQKWRGEVISKRILVAKELQNWEGVEQLSQQARKSVFYQVDATSIPIVFYEGLAQLNLKETEKALESLKKAYLIHPNNIHVINNLASIYQMLNDTENAILYYEEVLRISPKFKDGALNLAALYFNTNNVLESYNTLVRYRNNFIYDDTIFRQYLVVVLRTMSENLAEEVTEIPLKNALLNVQDEELIKVFEKNFSDTTSIFQDLLKNRVEHLQLEKERISGKD